MEPRRGTVAVTVTDVGSQPALNGKAAELVGFDPAKGRYAVVVNAGSGGGKPILMRPSKVVLPAGSKVTLQGLTTPKYNGLPAEIVAPHVKGKPERTGVKLLSGQRFTVKRDNVVLTRYLGAAGSPAPPTPAPAPTPTPAPTPSPVTGQAGSKRKRKEPIKSLGKLFEGFVYQGSPDGVDTSLLILLHGMGDK